MNRCINVVFTLLLVLVVVVMVVVVVVVVIIVIVVVVTVCQRLTVRLCVLVSWSLTSIFSTNMAISETKYKGVPIL